MIVNTYHLKVNGQVLFDVQEHENRTQIVILSFQEVQESLGSREWS